MSMNDGGPAFPVGHVPPDHVTGFPGMSLRDWFAGQALQGLVSTSIRSSGTVGLAGLAYDYADAMLDRKRAIERHQASGEAVGRETGGTEQ